MGLEGLVQNIGRYGKRFLIGTALASLISFGSYGGSCGKGGDKDTITGTDKTKKAYDEYVKRANEAAANARAADDLLRQGQDAARNSQPSQYSYDISGTWEFYANSLTNSGMKDMKCSASGTFELEMGSERGTSEVYDVRGTASNFSLSCMRGGTLYMVYPRVKGQITGGVRASKRPYLFELVLFSTSLLTGVVDENNQLNSFSNLATFNVPNQFLGLPGSSRTPLNGSWKATRK
ncbi:MAG: hypothetical protein KJ905_00535 [Nanoarchaeota archaeon]|nr:hypothetical protein [Nanoarchaeota archaeon]MBU1501247.1 hypothetical protein [Nanoarchaeota archaeon]MBU2459134.1 hypothetical protein [Nanoarchaeota archaeon]